LKSTCARKRLQIITESSEFLTQSFQGKGFLIMARMCTMCGKGPQVVNSVSNANNRVKHWVYPNVHSMRFKITGNPDNKVTRGKVCTKCVKSGKIQKVV